jgi:hypothetical protein
MLAEEVELEGKREMVKITETALEKTRRGERVA